MGPIEAAAAAMFGTGVGVGLLGAIAITFAIWLGWIAVRQWGPRRLQGTISQFPVVGVFVPLLVIAVPAGCVWAFRTPVAQPATNRQIAAIEVPLQAPADRADLLAMLQRSARAGGLHMDDDSERWVQFRREAPASEPTFARNVLTKTIYVGLWRGADDTDLEVSVDDGGHQGRPWVTFLRGKHPELATKVRAELLAEIKRRWPEARDVPVMPNGSLPLADDLVWTGTSYAVKPERLAGYALRGG